MKSEVVLIKDSLCHCQNIFIFRFGFLGLIFKIDHFELISKILCVAKTEVTKQVLKQTFNASYLLLTKVSMVMACEGKENPQT